MNALLKCTTAIAALAVSAQLAFAGPETVSGPGADPGCFAPWSADTKYFQWPAKDGPYRVAVVNGFVGNTWRIQMIKTAKAFAEDPAVKDKIGEFKVVSTGTDAPAQLGAIEDFINQGFEAVLIDPNTPKGWDRVIRLANQKGAILIAFDNQVETKDMAGVAQDQIIMGKQGGQWLEQGPPQPEHGLRVPHPDIPVCQRQEEVAMCEHFPQVGHGVPGLRVYDDLHARLLGSLGLTFPAAKIRTYGFMPSVRVSEVNDGPPPGPGRKRRPAPRRVRTWPRSHADPGGGRTFRGRMGPGVRPGPPGCAFRPDRT